MFKFVFLFYGFPVAERRLEADVLFDGVRRRPSLLAPALFRGGVKSDVPVVGGDVCPVSVWCVLPFRWEDAGWVVAEFVVEFGETVTYGRCVH